MALSKTAVTSATEQKILALAYEVSGKLSIKKSRPDIQKAAALARLLRVISNSKTQLDYNDLQILMQSCIKIGDLTL